VDAAVDFSWVSEEVAPGNSPAMGLPSFDPEAALPMTLVGHLLGIVGDRRSIPWPGRRFEA